ncbi:hypothetical protein D7Z54_06505 [Salibacterium salarium]|uniref:DUF5666 domain-containing protein n=1 Tax=Salibacterium salarium TaxID=284579 RepID=A0A3R9PMR3_9BACI|nr:hypothetical protein [Salibacterium salarium]RSL34209.1 hypothetical protein D7Z54_06505 [Salibacterium salarium]
MFKRKLFLISLFTLLAVGAGCSADETEPSESSAEKTSDDAQSEETNKSASEEKKSEEPKENQGDTNIDIDGDISFIDDDDKIRVEGTTNLVPGSTISVHFDVVNKMLIGYGTTLRVEEDGSFSDEIDFPNYDEPVELMFTFAPNDQEEDVQEVYGEYGEKLEGPFVRVDPDEVQENGDPVYMGYLDFTFDVDEERETQTIEAPNYQRPEDYGETDVWMDIESKVENGFMYIEGESNMLEGLGVNGTVKADNYMISGYTNADDIRPDGSFQLSVPLPSEDSISLDANPYVEVSMDPWYQLEHFQEVYGEEGEQLEGDLVNTSGNDEIISQEIEITELPSSK